MAGVQKTRWVSGTLRWGTFVSNVISPRLSPRQIVELRAFFTFPFSRFRKYGWTGPLPPFSFRFLPFLPGSRSLVPRSSMGLPCLLISRPRTVSVSVPCVRDVSNSSSSKVEVPQHSSLLPCSVFFTSASRPQASFRHLLSFHFTAGGKPVDFSMGVFRLLSQPTSTSPFPFLFSNRSRYPVNSVRHARLFFFRRLDRAPFFHPLLTCLMPVRISCGTRPSPARSPQSPDSTVYRPRCFPSSSGLSSPRLRSLGLMVLPPTKDKYPPQRAFPRPFMCSASKFPPFCSFREVSNPFLRWFPPCLFYTGVPAF